MLRSYLEKGMDQVRNIVATTIMFQKGVKYMQAEETEKIILIMLPRVADIVKTCKNRMYLMQWKAAEKITLRKLPRVMDMVKTCTVEKRKEAEFLIVETILVKVVVVNLIIKSNKERKGMIKAV